MSQKNNQNQQVEQTQDFPFRVHFDKQRILHHHGEFLLFILCQLTLIVRYFAVSIILNTQNDFIFFLDFMSLLYFTSIYVIDSCGIAFFFIKCKSMSYSYGSCCYSYLAWLHLKQPRVITGTREPEPCLVLQPEFTSRSDVLHSFIEVSVCASFHKVVHINCKYDNT